FYFSASNPDRAEIVCTLLKISGLNEDAFINCEAFGVDGEKVEEVYRGWCFPTHYHLYVVWEDVRLFSELVFGVLNLPDRRPPVLNGIFLGLSGGMGRTTGVFRPCAARVAWRYKGNETQLAKELKCAPNEVEEILKQTIPARCTPVQFKEKYQSDAAEDKRGDIVGIISNLVCQDNVPFALIMDGISRPYK
ncbi:MAG: hypothetical protein JO071_12380, partial [Deltaproteobacteria bacterium]|nr:hypothetical protein [Deltaproteobacteria bacterium]